MQQDTEQQWVASGIWKFNCDVPLESLIELTKEWKSRDNGERYLELYICTNEKDVRYIVFKFSCTSEESFRKYRTKRLKELKRLFKTGLIWYEIGLVTFVAAS